MELRVGDLVQHKKHGFLGIVLSSVGYYGKCPVSEVGWCVSRKRHFIDINFLDKLN